ncbi:DUF4917 family protein [Candidatus Bipolaricaulota bacterium]|nr:DUF4917 family protein [Candidatus Bipolaricaulota bacterium]
MNDKVYEWGTLKDGFNDSLILGNGASIAFDKRFAYKSLKERAQERDLISADVQSVFDHLNTADFELVLRMLWHASKINEALAIRERRTTQAYHNVREALIEVIRSIHVPYEEVDCRLVTAATFMSHFSTVISLCYDLLVYWAILKGNEDAPNRFKDCFVSGEFQHDWKPLRKPYADSPRVTLVFYPHGNLALAADLSGREFKIATTPGAGLLDTVFHCWCAGEAIPLFVSEGTTEQKRAAIRRSPYLSTVCDEVMPDVRESVVVYGWSISDTDDHLLKQVCRSAARRFAVSVDPQRGNLGEFQAMVHRKLEERLTRNRCELMFFDRSSEGCWIAP